MNREYELFKKLPDGSPIWCDHVTGLEIARLKLAEIAKDTTDECFAMYLPTKEIVLRMNVSSSEEKRYDPPPEI
jgi:hypothetical protein